MKAEILVSLTPFFKILMPVYRVFVAKPLAKSTTLTIEGDEWKHLSKVLRVREGDSVTVINGKGELAQTKLSKLEKLSGELQVEQTEQKALQHTLILRQALMRASKLDWICEKATELGVTKIEFFPAEKSEITSLSANKLLRLEHILISALKQSGRLHLPQIEMVDSLHLDDIPSFYGGFSEDAFTLHDLPAEMSAMRWIVGPESGFSKKEIKSLQRFKAKPFSLGKAVLRAETAAIVGVGVFALKVNC
jgi:16S rRNA (uracil1498-N3)-methyltransferase